MPERVTFDQFMNVRGEEWLRTMAERAGVAGECDRRGWDGLLALKTIRLGVVVPLVLAHAKMFQDRELEEAHFGDLHHVVTATCADVFVTHDGRLRELIHRSHVPDLEILTLTQLVRRLEATADSPTEEPRAGKAEPSSSAPSPREGGRVRPEEVEFEETGPSITGIINTGAPGSPRLRTPQEKDQEPKEKGDKSPE